MGVALGGAPRSLATGRTAKLVSPPVDASELKNDVILTRLNLVLTPGATVAQVEAALLKVDGSIVTMERGSTFITVAIPKPASLAALEQARSRLAASAGIAFAFLASQAGTNVLPGEAPGAPAANIGDFSHLLATRFPAAWNAKGLIVDSSGNCRLPAANRVPILIPDSCAAAAQLNSDFAGLADELPPANFRLVVPATAGASDSHGYNVAAALAASFANSPITGGNPFIDCLSLRGVPFDGLDMNSAFARLVDNMPAGRFIISSSIGFSTGCAGETCTVAEINRAGALNPPIASALYALKWKAITKLRGRDFLVVSAAGNDRLSGLAQLYLGFAQARFESWFNMATDTSALFAAIHEPLFWRPSNPTFPDLTARARDRVALAAQAQQLGLASAGPVTNTLIVGATTKAAAFADLERAFFSEDGAAVNTVGMGIFGFPSLPVDGLDGTSFAAPQVAGLAAYLWLLSPELRARPVEETLDLIKATARDNGHVAHVIDAYAAVLALDKFDTAQRPIRRALMDVNDDAVFNQVDLGEFQNAYQLLDANRPSAPAADYSRYDLNGDGATGGAAMDKFDLDADGSFGTVQLEVEGQTVSFDETLLTDVQILCYQAYSDLYTDSVAARSARSAVLGLSNCMGLRIRAALPAVIDPRVPVEMVVTVERPSGNDQFEPVVGIPLRFTSQCTFLTGVGPPDPDGDSPSASGPTDSAGQRRVLVEGVRTCAALSIDIQAGAARTTVNAALQGSCPPLAAFSKVAEARVTPGPSQEGLDLESSGALQRTESGTATAASNLGRDGWSGGATASAGFDAGEVNVHLAGDFLLRVGASAQVFASEPVGILPADPSFIGQRGTILVRTLFAPGFSFSGDQTLDIQATASLGVGGTEHSRTEFSRGQAAVGDAPGFYEGTIPFTIGENVGIGYSADVLIFVSGFGNGAVHATLGASKTEIVAVRGPTGQPLAHSLCTPAPAP